MRDVSFVLAAVESGPIEAIAGQFGVTWPLLTAQVVNFCLVAFVLYRFAFKPVLATMDERKRQIAAGLQYAEEVKLQLAESEKQCSAKLHEASLEAQKIMTDARETAKQHLEHQTETAARKAEHMITQAEAAMQNERKQMVESVRKEVAGLVVETTKKVLTKELTDNDRTSYTQAATRELVGSS